MLNKDLILCTQSSESAHIALTVDKSGTYFGYSKQRYGSVNRLPYWNSLFSKSRFTLNGLFFDKSAPATLISGKTTVNYPSNEQKSLTVTIGDVSETFTLKTSPNTDNVNGIIYRKDIFSLKDSVGKDLLVSFDPPPDGYITPN